MVIESKLKCEDCQIEFLGDTPKGDTPKDNLKREDMEAHLEANPTHQIIIKYYKV